MNNAIASGTNTPAALADVPIRPAVPSKSNLKTARDGDETDAKLAFEQKFSEAERTIDGKASAVIAKAIAGKSATVDGDTGSPEKKDTPDARPGESDDSATPMMPVTAAASLWAGQLGSATANNPSQPAMKTPTKEVVGPSAVRQGAQIYLLREKSTAALLASRDLTMFRDAASGTDPATRQPDSTKVTVNSSEAHWIFASPAGTSEALNVPASAPQPLTNSAQTLLASLLSGSGAKQTVDSSTKQDDTPADTNEVATTAPAAKSKTEMPQQAVASVVPEQNAKPDQRWGDAPAARDPQLKPADKVTVSLSDSAPLADAIAPANNAPASPAASIAQQVRTSIVDTLRNDTQAPLASPSPGNALDRPVVAGQVLRTIDLTLEPPDLGAIKLRLSLNSNALSIDAEASKASTAKLLNDDRDSLEKSLRTAGYDVSAIRVADASNASGAMLGGGSSFQDGSQTRMSYTDRGTGDLPRRSGDQTPNQDRRSPNDQRQSRQSPDPASVRQPGALYI